MFWIISQYLIMLGIFTYCFVYAIRNPYVPYQIEEFAELYLGIDYLLNSDDEDTEEETGDEEDEETGDEEDEETEEETEEDEEDEETEEETGETNDFQMPTVGSHIKFTMIFDDKRPPRAMKRAISTYGYNAVDPDEGETYIVVNITNDCYIPNGKGATAKTCVGTTIYVYPLEHFDDSNTEVFWYINYNDKTICQYEDGFPLFKLTSITNVGHKTDDNYLFSPTPV